MKFVEFENCTTCKYVDIPEEDEPCRECLQYPVNETIRPINYKENENERNIRRSSHNAN